MKQCTRCNYKWQPRKRDGVLIKPKACPWCHRYFKKPEQIKDVE